MFGLERKSIEMEKLPSQMESSKDTKKYGSMTDGKFQELLATMKIGPNLVKPAATFSRTSGQASINLHRLINSNRYQVMAEIQPVSSHQGQCHIKIT